MLLYVISLQEVHIKPTMKYHFITTRTAMPTTTTTKRKISNVGTDVKNLEFQAAE